MKNFCLGQVDYFVSDDEYKKTERMYSSSLPSEIPELIAERVEKMFDEYLSDSDFGRYIQTYGKLIGKERVAVLCAHGGPSHLGWLYNDGARLDFVQSWVNQHDGQYACILVCVCNGGSQSVTSKKSLLVSPDRTLSVVDKEIGRVSFVFYNPKMMLYQKIITGYTIASDLESLLRRVSV